MDFGNQPAGHLSIGHHSELSIYTRIRLAGLMYIRWLPLLPRGFDHYGPDQLITPVSSVKPSRCLTYHVS